MPDPIREELNNLWQMNQMLSERVVTLEDELKMQKDRNSKGDKYENL